MTSVRVTISRFIDESFPGWVECLLEDARGRTWRIHEKAPVVTVEDLRVESEYPRNGVIACTVLDRKSNAEGRRIVTIDTDSPWRIESTDGSTVFDVFVEQLEGGTAESRSLISDP